MAKKAKQPFLNEDMAPPSIKAIDNAADNYYDAMMERVGLSKAEDEAKGHLTNRMKEHQLERYETRSGIVVSITSKSNVRAKKKNADENESED